jgi:hypothetical protein
MGHGGHAGMSMESMVRDMRNRFLLAAILSIPMNSAVFGLLLRMSFIFTGRRWGVKWENAG